MNIHLTDPFDLDDHRPRRATELDNFIAAGVREVEAKREARSETCPDCFGDGCGGQCLLCAGWGTVAPSLAELRRSIIAQSPATDISRAWEAASGEGQVTS